MKKLYLGLFFFLFTFAATATHIVGGELQLEALSNTINGATHRLSLNLYFDDINGNVGANDLTVLISVFRKRDDARMGDLELPRISDQIIPYSNPLCASAGASLRTRFIKYATEVIFRESAFDDPQGYYIVWERCCRNNIITNIVNPQNAGTTFYLEMPPLVRGGRVFKNSSPQFQMVKGDFICLNRPFTFDFSATDSDKDSLRYSLVTPYNGFSTSGNPRPVAVGNSSYPAVTWLPGYSAAASISGNPPLTINPRTGQLSVVANRIGLYVFSVMVEEFRGGQKIGLVRRDFQLKVIDCPMSAPPQVMAREKGKTQFYKKGEIMQMVQGSDRCIDLFFTDKDPNSRLNLKVKALNPDPLQFSITPSQVVIQTGSDTAKAQICLGACAESFGGRPVQFQVIASDESCPLPQHDTLTISVLVQPRPNQKPTISTTLPNNQATVTIGNSLDFKIDGVDLDPDSIRIIARGQGFDLTSAGMTFTPSAGLGKAQSSFNWKPVCSTVRKEPYLVDFYVVDLRCGRNLTDSVRVSLQATGRPSRPPQISTSLPGNRMTVTIDGMEAPSIKFNVNGIDPDNDPLTLTGQGRGFSLPSVGMKWSDRTGTGTVSGPFEWTPSCEFLEGQPEKMFTIDFVTADNSCNPDNRDTVSVQLLIRDKSVSYEFIPPNVFTPNNDGKNDYFGIDDLPQGNCIEQFEYVEIYNRWGKRVFHDTKPNFKWLGENFPTGQYYYHLKYTKREYKGVVSLLR